MDGWVVVGTKLDTKQLDKDLNLAKKQLQQYEKEAERLTKSKAKVELDLKGYYEAKKNIEEMTNEALAMAQSEKEVNAQLSLEKIQLEELNTKYSKGLNNIEEISQQMTENAQNQKIINALIDEMNAKLIKAQGFQNISNDIEKIKKGTDDSIKKVGKWALAIFGIRSAYMYVRQAASTLSQYNEQIAADLQHINFAIASMLQPVVETMIQLAYKLLTYVGYIAKAWFGVDLFANSSAKAMNKSAKSAEKMKKTLAGFDEMNVLNENGTTGAIGASTPSVDLSKPEDIPVPEWIKWIAENKDVVIATLAGIATGLTAIHFGLSLIKGLGIGVIVAGIVLLIQDIIAMIKDPSWENFFKILSDVAVIIGGIMLLMGNWWGLLVVFVAELVRLVVENWDKIKSILVKVWEWIEKYVVIPVWNIIKALFDTIWSIIKAFFNLLYSFIYTIIDLIVEPFRILGRTIRDVINGAITTFKGLFNVIKGLFTNDWKMVMEGFKSIFKGTFDALWSIAKAPLNLIIGGINSLIKGLNKIQFDVPDWVPEIGGKKLGFNIPTIPKLAKGTILNNPGYGVPVAGGSAIAGEAGREAYLPLSNTQLLEELGSTIGKYITINANITNSMNGRVISRELKKINASDNFAMNSR